MVITNILEYYKEKIELRLRSFLDEKIAEAEKISDSSKEIMQYIKEFNLRGGKRIRSVLVIMAYKSLGGKNENAIIDIAVSAELMQSFLLIHDDIIDDDDLRRGGPTMHKIYAEKYKNYDHPRKFGESMAIIAGDLLASLGNEIIAKSDFDEKKKLKLLQKFNKVIKLTDYGEIIDILSGLRTDVTEEDISKMHRLKTAVYTIEGPLHMGAIAAGASDEQLKTLTNYAIPLGRAFQIKDDILGMFGSETKLGKPADSDIKEGKKTLLILKAIESADKEQKEFIENALGNKNITKTGLINVREIIKKTGSLSYSESLAEKLVKKAKDAVKNSDFEKQGKNFFLEIADYIIKRDY
ncbi:MAG TPA: polyprenyl synthetase family protein [Candidatus Woesearchaeota archaeon]|nr:polyprenyl synthetase family protein [Candidatus Woesearchaeota archaeon]